MTWQLLSACRDHDPEVFFPTNDDERSPRGRAAHDAAKRVCAGCPVREACLRFALDSGEDHGVWGGTSKAERRAVRRGRRRTAVETAPPGLPARVA